jgi:cell division protein FtsW
VNGSAIIDGIRPAGDRKHSSAPPPKNRHVAPSNHPPARNGKDEVRPGDAPSSVAFGNLLKSSPSGPVDSVLAAVVIALVGFGVVMVYSASAIEATVRHHDAQYFLKRQALYALTALFTMWLASRFDYRKLRPFTYPILVLVTGLHGLTSVGLGPRPGTA